MQMNELLVAVDSIDVGTAVAGLSTSRLNEDVLREIFVTHCIYAPENLSTCFVVGGLESSIRDLPQLSVSRVCSSWRHVALLTPQLWNNIKIPGFTNTTLSIAREYLSRAENLPVSITIYRCRTDKRLTDFLSSYRLRILEVPSSFHLVLPDLPQRSVADLESLVMLGQDTIDDQGSIDLNDIRYPKLAVVRIMGGRKVSGYRTSLRIFNGLGLLMTVIESWDLLSCCPSLEDALLWITRDDGMTRRPDSVPLIQLRHLRFLKLHARSGMDEIPFSTFIEALALPVIEKLWVVDTLSDGRVAWSSTAFQSLAHRSNYFPHLRYIALRNPASVVDTSALLKSMPSLKSMSLSWSISNNNIVFDDLVLNGLASGLLAPQLQSLSVGRISNEGEFIDMVKSRMKNAQMSTNGVPAPFTEVWYRRLPARLTTGEITAQVED